MSTPRVRLQLLRPAPVRWLLDRSEPPARLRALRELFDQPADAPEVREAQAAVLAHAPVKAMFDAQHGDGSWGDLGKEDGDDGTAWRLAWLLRMGVPPRDPRLVAGAGALRSARFIGEDLRRSETPVGAWSTSRAAADVASCATGDGLAVSLAILGPVEENRRSVLWLLAHQRHDGGWLHCHRWSVRARLRALLPRTRTRLEWPEESDPSVRSCRFGTYRAMRGLATLSEELRDEHVRKALTRGAEHFLARGITGSLDRPDVDVTTHVRSFNAGLQLVGTPVRQTADMLAIARLLVDLGYGADPRLARTIMRIRDTQGADGTWRAAAAGPGMLDEQVGQPSKWVTTEALALLRRAARSHGAELDLGAPA